MGALTGLTRKQVSAKLAEDVSIFVLNGGKIQYLEYDPAAEIAARVGVWQYQGDTTMDDLVPEYDGEPMPDDLLTFGYQFDRDIGEGVNVDSEEDI